MDTNYMAGLGVSPNNQDEEEQKRRLAEEFIKSKSGEVANTSSEQAALQQAGPEPTDEPTVASAPTTSTTAVTTQKDKPESAAWAKTKEIMKKYLPLALRVGVPMAAGGIIGAKVPGMGPVTGLAMGAMKGTGDYFANQDYLKGLAGKEKVAETKANAEIEKRARAEAAANQRAQSQNDSREKIANMKTATDLQIAAMKGDAAAKEEAEKALPSYVKTLRGALGDRAQSSTTALLGYYDAVSKGDDTTAEILRRAHGADFKTIESVINREFPDAIDSYGQVNKDRLNEVAGLLASYFGNPSSTAYRGEGVFPSVTPTIAPGTRPSKNPAVNEVIREITLPDGTKARKVN